VPGRYPRAVDEIIRDIAGHVSKQTLKHYSHIRMEAKRRALEAIVEKKADGVHYPVQADLASSDGARRESQHA
jgi:hypothetical protein